MYIQKMFIFEHEHVSVNIVQGAGVGNTVYV